MSFSPDLYITIISNSVTIVYLVYATRLNRVREKKIVEEELENKIRRIVREEIQPINEKMNKMIDTLCVDNEIARRFGLCK